VTVLTAQPAVLSFDSIWLICYFHDKVSSTAQPRYLICVVMVIWLFNDVIFQQSFWLFLVCVGVAASELYLVQSLDCGDRWKLLNTVLPATLQNVAHCSSHCCITLMHTLKTTALLTSHSYLRTLFPTHSSWIVKTKQKEREHTWFITRLLLKWKLNKHTPPVIYHITKSLRFLHYLTGNATNLWIGRLNCPELVFTLATLTWPSEPGNVSDYW
jgi:hypothetical protein